MARDSLYCCWDTALLLFHGRCPLPSYCLLVHAGLLRNCAVICRRHLHRCLIHGNLAVWIRL